MVIAPLHLPFDPSTVGSEAPLHAAAPSAVTRPAHTVTPAPAPVPCSVPRLEPGAMAAVPLEPGERVDAAWVDRMRGPYTSRARHLLERALAPVAPGPPAPAGHGRGPVPTWAAEAAACQRGLLDALGLDLPLASDDSRIGHGPVLVQHLVPAITLGWYVVTTVLATGDAVFLVEGSYAEHGSAEAPFPVRWG